MPANEYIDTVHGNINTSTTASLKNSHENDKAHSSDDIKSNTNLNLTYSHQKRSDVHRRVYSSLAIITRSFNCITGRVPGLL